ncbi:MAG: hypothetical protein IPH66_05525 [Crocinitomicaceae bacterium]|nr:hypothetical protein [Crocinitomicaceae bacterium]
MNDYVLNGVQHATTVQSNMRLFGGRMMLTPSVNYAEIWNFQYEKNTWNPGSEKIDTVSFEGFKSSRTLSFNAGLNTNFYGYYKMLGKREMKFRHVASPNLSFSFRPDIGLYEEIQYDTLGNTKYYSPFQTSLYREQGFGQSGIISFGLANTLEMKMLDKKILSMKHSNHSNWLMHFQSTGLMIFSETLLIYLILLLHSELQNF